MNQRVLVVGGGSIGSRHLGNLRAMGVTGLAVADPEEGRRRVHEANGVRGFAALEEAIAAFHPTAALVCTPPVFHVQQALTLVNAGADVFIEKPIGVSHQGIAELAAAARGRDRVVQVGYNLRFHPVLTAVRRVLDAGSIGRVLYACASVSQYLPDWRPGTDYRKSYTAQAGLGGGILLDASHEIDYVLSLLGTPATVSCQLGKASQLDVDVEDSATLLLGYANGVHAVVHMDFVRRGYKRTLDLVGETGNVVADLGSGTVRLERGKNDSELVPTETVDMYRAELAHFLDCVITRKQPMITIEDGRRALDVVLLGKAAAADGIRRPVAGHDRP